MNSLRFLRISVCCVACWSAIVAAAEQPLTDDVAVLCDRVRDYDISKSRESLDRISVMAKSSNLHPDVRKKLAAGLAGLLGENTSDATKDFVCRQLAIVGGDDEVAKLTPLLLNPNYSDMARFALEGIRGEKTLVALRASLGNTSGKTLIGIINSLAALQDKHVVGRLVELSTNADNSVAASARSALARIEGVEAAKALASLAPLPVDETGFVPLFNGKDLTGWSGSGWTVENGVMVCNGGFLTWSKDQFANFVLRFEVKLSPGANNGLNFRSRNSNWNEIQILEESHPAFANIQPYQAHGSIYGVVAAKRGYQKPVGEWNTEEVLADGNHIRVTLNGAVIVDTDLARLNLEKCLDGNAHPGLLDKSGDLGWLGHLNGDEKEGLVYFRNVRIKVLP